MVCLRLILSKPWVHTWTTAINIGLRIIRMCFLVPSGWTVSSSTYKKSPMYSRTQIKWLLSLKQSHSRWSIWAIGVPSMANNIITNLATSSRRKSVIYWSIICSRAKLSWYKERKSICLWYRRRKSIVGKAQLENIKTRNRK
jgi:hypothetical protein